MIPPGFCTVPPAPRHAGRARGSPGMPGGLRPTRSCLHGQGLQCLYSVSITNAFAGMSSIYTYVQSPTPSLLLAAQRGAGWLGRPGFASLLSFWSGYGSRQVPPNLSWSLAVLLPCFFAVWVLEQAGSGLKSVTRRRCEAGREEQRCPRVRKQQLSFQIFRTGRLGWGLLCPLLTIPPLSSPGQGTRPVQPRPRGWRLSLSGLKSARSQQGLQQPREM